MKKIAFAFVLAATLIGVRVAMVYAVASTCADGGIACYAACHTSSACATAQGGTYTGMCIGGANQYSASCPIIHCGSNTPICGAITNISGKGAGCSSDSACGTGFVCAASGGPGSCGTGWAQCVSSCSDATTTTTTTAAPTTTT